MAVYSVIDPSVDLPLPSPVTREQDPELLKLLHLKGWSAQVGRSKSSWRPSADEANRTTPRMRCH